MPDNIPTSLTVLIASYLEPEFVEQLRAVDDRLTVIYEPELLRPPRYAADHVGKPVERSAAQEARWQALLAKADILFDFDHTHREDLPDLAPNVRWIQATSAGIGQFVKRMGYDVRMPATIFTTASGVHAAPLAEFCLMSILNHYRGLAHLQACQRNHHWERFATTDLQGKTVAIIGLGKIGGEVARLCKAFGMNVVGAKHDAVGGRPRGSALSARRVARHAPARGCGGHDRAAHAAHREDVGRAGICGHERRGLLHQHRARVHGG